MDSARAMGLCYPGSMRLGYMLNKFHCILILQEEKSRNKWESVSFEGEGGGQAQLKFRRLMGISK